MSDQDLEDPGRHDPGSQSEPHPIPTGRSNDADGADSESRTADYSERQAHGGEDMDLRRVVAVLRRRWWVVAAVSAVALAAAWTIRVYIGNRYTATSLIEKKEQKSPLDLLANQVGATGISSDVMASEVEIVRSDGVLGPVVDTLGLEISSAQGYGAVRRVFSEVSVSPNVLHRAYIVSADTRGELVLHSRVPKILSRALPGRWLDGPGFRLRVAPAVALTRPLKLTVLYREEAIKALRKDASISEVGQTSLIRVTYTARDPRMAAAIVNTIAHAYEAYSTATAQAQARRRRDFIAGQLKQIADSLSRAQDAQLAYQQASGTLDPQEEGQALITALMSAEKDLRELRYEEGVLAALSQSLQKNGDVREALRQAVALGDDVVPGVQDLYKRLLDARAQRDRLTASQYGYTASGPQVQVVDSILASTRREIKALSDQSLKVVRARRDAAQQQVKALQAQVHNLPSRSTQFARFRQQTDAIQSTYDLLAGKYYEAQIDEAVEGGGVNIVDPATVPALPDPKHTLRDFALALLLGLMLGTGGAFVVEYFDASVRDAADAEDAARLEVLGVIPVLPRSANGSAVPLVVGDAAPHPGAEAFRAVRTMIRFARTTRPQVVAVTSPGPGEGKTSVAVNLAAAMVQDGVRVLLIDADLRRPAVHGTFHLSRTPGLTDVLVGETTVEAAVRNVDGGELGVLTCGTETPNPAELLGSPAFRQLLTRARESYDAVVLDTPPVLAVTDPAVLVPAVDGMVVVARAGITDRFALGHAAETLRHIAAPLLGVVVNGVTPGGGYGRSHYYYYYHNYGGHHERSGHGRVPRLRRRRHTKG